MTGLLLWKNVYLCALKPYKNMKKSIISLLSVPALLFILSCVDNNYDMSDIDTTSRFNISNLTLPLNLDPVKLGVVLDIKDDSDIKTDEYGNYYFWKDGSFTSGTVNVKKIVITRPDDVSIAGSVSVNVNLSQEVRKKIKQYASDMTMGQLLENPELMRLIGISEDTPILEIRFDNSSSKCDVCLNASGIDSNVKGIDSLGVEQTAMAINVNVQGIKNVLEPFTLEDIELVMPKGVQAQTSEGITYDPVKGTLTPDGGRLGLDNNYSANLSLTMMGINYHLLEEEGMKVFDPEKHTFAYRKTCSVSGHATLTFADVKKSVTYADVEEFEAQNNVKYECNIGFNKNIVIGSFLGSITYSMDDIKVDPVVINNIPDILKEAGTNIDLRNPQIYLDIDNSLGKYGISVNSALEIKGNNTITAPLEIKAADRTGLVLAPLQEDLFHKDGYEFEEVKDLGRVVGSNDGQTFPEQLNIRVIKPEVPETKLLEELKLGENLKGVGGRWEFYTKLSLTDSAKVKYSKEWNDWSDENLNGLTVNSAVVNVTIMKDVALDAESIGFVLFGKEGELRGETAITGEVSQDIVIRLEGEQLKEIQGAKIDVRLKGVNKDLNRNQKIQVSNLKLTVDGYYDRKF